MRLFRRKREDASGDDGAPEASDAYDSSADSGEVPEEITAGPIGEQEQERIETALRALAERGIDVDDLGSLSEAFDAAVDGDNADDLPLLAIGVGEYLHRHASLRWAMVSDAFGTDLGLEGRRRDLHIVPQSLLSARWMRREKGWLDGAVRHLASTSTR